MAADWQRLIDQSREHHSQATLDQALPDTPEAINAMKKARGPNGLYVGPWQLPGPPLPDDWQ